MDLQSDVGHTVQSISDLLVVDDPLKFQLVRFDTCPETLQLEVYQLDLSGPGSDDLLYRHIKKTYCSLKENVLDILPRKVDRYSLFHG